MSLRIMAKPERFATSLIAMDAAFAATNGNSSKNRLTLPSVTVEIMPVSRAKFLRAALRLVPYYPI